MVSHFAWFIDIKAKIIRFAAVTVIIALFAIIKLIKKLSGSYYD